MVGTTSGAGSRRGERARVLFVDDLERSRELFARLLEGPAYAVETAASVVEACAAIERERPDVVVTDLRMPEVDGLEGLQRFRTLAPDVPVIVVTAFGSIETAVEAMRLGAFDYLSKPFDRDPMALVLRRAVDHRRLLQENQRLRAELAERGNRGGVVGRSDGVQRALALVERVAPTDYPVLIQGESGTGKDVFARLIHERSARAGRAFVSLNCSAIPEHLLESELFGHEKGAFSGAVTARPGFFSRADQGTLFLDEIGDMSVGLQPKLLRVLQNGEYYPVGARRPETCDVRLVCASNQDIPARVESGQFRQDLYYRINTIRIVLPPLRERVGDVGLLAHHFLAALRERSLPFPPPTELAPETLARLEAYTWPGNVRELAHVIDHCALIADGDVIEPEHLPPEVRSATDGGGRDLAAEAGAPQGFQDARRDFERQYFTRLLQETEGNVQRAAERAGVHRTTLYEKLSKLDIDPRS